MTDYKLFYENDDSVEVGLDEAGRGCLYGRLYVGAVVFSKDIEAFFDNGATLKTIKDSKVISQRKRDVLYDYIKDCAIDYAVSYAEASEIDTFNILQTDIMTMHRALDSLYAPIGRILVDGDYWRPYKDIEGYAIVDGDAKYLSIAAAGILAKVSRDRWIEEVVAANPELNEKYGLLSNKGYGTAKHMTGIKEHGVTADHRRTYGPVAEALGMPKKPKRIIKKTKDVPKWEGID
jgi:ribonuclease HII